MHHLREVHAMKLTRFALSAAIAATTVAAALAQAPSNPRTSPSPSAAKADQVTVTGCLERAPAAADAAIGSNGVEPGPIFVLNKATDGASSGTAGAAGTSGTTRPQGPTRYRLQTANVPELVAHEGAEVQVTGAQQDMQGDSGGKAGSGTKAPTLKIVSIKTVAPNCTR